jgi:predicted RNA-binding Zn ribbon-like protein
MNSNDSVRRENATPQGRPLMGRSSHSTVDELNRQMAEHPMRTRLKANSLVHSAAMLFASVDRNRVRKCDLCVLHFHDTSKKGTRRWCSMQLCGNRLKVAAYVARQRSATFDE